MKVAIAQLVSTDNKSANLKKAKDYIRKAKQLGADFVILPELFMALTKPASNLSTAEVAESLDGPFVTRLAAEARANEIYVVCGLYESIDGDEKRAYNTTVTIDRSGHLLHSYRKTHLYDAFSFKESDQIAAGDNPLQVINTEFGKIGLMVCYEARFPEIARQFALQGADILFVPSAWVAGAMKEEHWEIMIRARAIENTMYVCASNQVDNIFTGRSMIVDPMGVIVSSAGEEETLIVAELDMERIRRVREKLPSVRNRVTKFYTLK